MLAMAEMSDEKITLREAAERFEVSIHTLRFWRDTGILSKWRRGRIVVVAVDEVKREVEIRKQPRRENGP